MYETKYYDHVISLGLNCEIANQIRSNYGNIESYLLTWAAVDGAHLKHILENPVCVLNTVFEYDKKAEMFHSAELASAFHEAPDTRSEMATGKEEVYNELEYKLLKLKARLRHLIEKQQALYKNNDKKLFILGLHPYFMKNVPIPIATYINDLYIFFNNNTTNSEILIIAERNLEQQLEKAFSIFQYKNLHLRYIAEFAPYNRAVIGKYLDCAGYKNIFDEFMTKFVLIERKKLKYEI